MQKFKLKRLFSRDTKAVTKGADAEHMAREFLEKQGLVFTTQNYRCRLGEIDLIMFDQDTLVFIEVRYRRSNAHGSSHETIGLTKQQRLIKAALCYLKQKQLIDKNPCRFDVIGITKIADDVNIQWIKNAFQLERSHSWI